VLKQQNKHWQLTWSCLDFAIFTDGLKAVSLEQWQHQLATARGYIAQQAGQSVLLFQADKQLFSVWFIALCQMDKHIVLAPDDQAETIKMAMAYCDWQVADIAFDQTTVRQQPQLQLTGNNQVSFFTSGSTGQPKLITKHLSQLLLEIQVLEQQFANRLTAHTLFAATVSHQHIYGLLFQLLWPLCYQRPIYQKQIKYLEQWQALLQQQQTAFIASPAHLARFDDLATLSPFAKQCQAIFSSGGPLADDAPARYITALGQAPIEVYGSTETGGIAYRQRQQATTPWQAFSGIKIEQTPEQALIIHSPYIDQFNPFISQDRVQLLDKQRFYLRGRLDRIVKIAEKRVSLIELEQYCRSCPLISEAATLVLQREQPRLGLVAVLSTSGQQLLQQAGKYHLNQQIKHYLLQRFERVTLPKMFRYVGALPYNQQGKLPLAQLETLFNDD
jgi:acyl-coenzyme A synthetase/AMP-(fatty) acid ligase